MLVLARLSPQAEGGGHRQHVEGNSFPVGRVVHAGQQMPQHVETRGGSLPSVRALAEVPVGHFLEGHGSFGRSRHPLRWDAVEQIIGILLVILPQHCGL
jgi:hypothetical protein